MADLEPLLRFWRAQDDVFDRVDLAWWGAVVSDPRYPAIQEPNYARVETRQPVTLGEVEAELLPAIGRSGARREHVVVFRPEEQTELLVAASTRGERLTWDLLMQTRRAIRSATSLAPGDEVAEVEDRDPGFWRRWRSSLPLFDVQRSATIDQLEAMERDVLIPGGRRWFVGRHEGRIEAFTALWVLEGAGYLDHVVTFPDARRRGFASALAARTVAEARAAGAERVYLLAEPDGAPARLYERLGFAPVTQIVSWLRPLDPEDDGRD